MHRNNSDSGSCISSAKPKFSNLALPNLLYYILFLGSGYIEWFLVAAQNSTAADETALFDDSCFELGRLSGRNPSSDTEL